MVEDMALPKRGCRTDVEHLCGRLWVQGHLGGIEHWDWAPGWRRVRGRGVVSGAQGASEGSAEALPALFTQSTKVHTRISWDSL